MDKIIEYSLSFIQTKKEAKYLLTFQSFFINL